ncbi:MAG: putative DNA binding domain-containing protein [Gammaproteobacteria bacterium]|nr:putative DNA binding domain-containing protein [Gammaproteobacteria bacterium]
MRTAEDIESLLAELDRCFADDLEDQDLDFKKWDARSRNSAVKSAVDMAVCMANGGGGTVVFGVADRIKERERAILGVPPEIDPNLLKKAVYERTDPKITPVFEELSVPEGSGRLLLMQIYPGMPPYTDTAGRGTIRIGKDCVPLTGTLRRKIGVETGETDYTAEHVAKYDPALLSAVAFEALRNQAHRERAPVDLMNLSDAELLSALGLIQRGSLTRAALMLAGTEGAIREHLHGHNWTFLQMTSDTDYGIREDRVSALPLSVQRIEELLVPHNPITTHVDGLFHFEYHTWPEVSVREALMNAFCHLDLRTASPVMVKLHDDHLEIGNPGGLIGGITPTNILHHQPTARNPLLVEALTRLRLVNRSNLGISRMFSALLMEGKEPPQITEVGESVSVSFPKSELNPAFRQFIAEEGSRGRLLNVDELLLLKHLLQQPEVGIGGAATLCQRSEAKIRSALSGMEAAGYIEHGGSGRGAYWCIHPELFNRLNEGTQNEGRRRIDWEAAKTRVLSILMERASRGVPGLGNGDIRRITRFDRNQVYRLMTELRRENPQLQSVGRGKYAHYEFKQ